MRWKAPVALRVILGLIPTTWTLLVHHWPGPLGNLLRYRYYKKRMKHLGERVTLSAGIHVVHPEFISIDDRTCIDRYVSLLAGPPNEQGRKFHHKPNDAFTGTIGEIRIGRGVHISPFAYLLGHGGLVIGDYSGVGSGGRVFSLSHHYQNLDDDADPHPYVFTSYAPLEDQALICGPIVIGTRCAVGLNSVVLPGTTIGDRTWVGTSSTAMGQLPPDSVAVGTPAKVVGQRSATRRTDAT